MRREINPTPPTLILASGETELRWYPIWIAKVKEPYYVYQCVCLGIEYTPRNCIRYRPRTEPAPVPNNVSVYPPEGYMIKQGWYEYK